MKNKHLWHLYTASAAIFPNDMALIVGDSKLTYQQLQQEVFFYIEYLRAQGVQQGDRVAVLLPRDSRLLVALLAILGCGATYVPLDARYPRQRCEAILNNSDSKFFLGEDDGYILSLIRLVPPTGDKLATLSQLPVQLNSQDLAYIIYTSGSTGVPKGVQINHENVCSMINWALSVYTREELA